MFASLADVRLLLVIGRRAARITVIAAFFGLEVGAAGCVFFVHFLQKLASGLFLGLSLALVLPGSIFGQRQRIITEFAAQFEMGTGL